MKFSKHYNTLLNKNEKKRKEEKKRQPDRWILTTEEKMRELCFDPKANSEQRIRIANGEGEGDGEGEGEGDRIMSGETLKKKKPQNGIEEKRERREAHKDEIRDTRESRERDRGFSDQGRVGPASHSTYPFCKIHTLRIENA